MRYLCVSAQLPGHLDWGGYLPTAAELQRRGEEVRWVSGGAVRSQVETAGVPFQHVVETGWRWPPPAPLPPPATPNDPAWQRLRAERALDQWLDVSRVAHAVDELHAIATDFQPHVVITEMFVAATGIVAEAIGVPLIVAGWPAIARAERGNDDDLVKLARARLQQLLSQAAIAGNNWTATGPPALRSPLLHLTYWSSSWYGGIVMEPQTVHVGGQATPADSLDPAYPDSGGRPWILITLGTSFNDDPNFFITSARAVDQLGCLPLVVAGQPLDRRQVRRWRDRLPPSAVVRAQVDFNAILPHTAAAIHHGGAGTTHALVTHAVPQIVVPHAADQMHQAQGVMRSGVGVHLPPRQVTPGRMEQALAALLPDLSHFRTRAATLRAEFADLGGVTRAADLLQEIRR